MFVFDQKTESSGKNRREKFSLFSPCRLPDRRFLVTWQIEYSRAWGSRRQGSHGQEMLHAGMTFGMQYWWVFYVKNFQLQNKRPKDNSNTPDPAGSDQQIAQMKLNIERLAVRIRTVGIDKLYILPYLYIRATYGQSFCIQYFMSYGLALVIWKTRSVLDVVTMRKSVYT